jgi:hypothetical protein
MSLPAVEDFRYGPLFRFRAFVRASLRLMNLSSSLKSPKTPRMPSLSAGQRSGSTLKLLSNYVLQANSQSKKSVKSTETPLF